MKYSLWFILLLALAIGAVADNPHGIAPRTDVSEYPARIKSDGAAVGAALISTEQVRKLFVTDLNRGYLVVEVAVYPGAGKDITVAPSDFVLRIDNTAVRPADPKTIAGVLYKTTSPDRNVAVYPQVGIGYESGPSIYDPVRGARRTRGVYTSVGVGVGVGGPQPPAPIEDRKTMELELTEKGLAQGKVSKPVAGYLYFPMPEKKKKANYQLEYALNGKKVVLKLAP
jgi:hypothetical protein